MEWIHAKDFRDLSSVDLYQMLRLRQGIFIVEQECIYQDIDNLDPFCEHILLKENGNVIGCSRIVPANKKFEHPSIGRIAVHKNYRRKGYGREIVQKALKILSARTVDVITIEAQSNLQAFYESFGFQKISNPYPLDGMLHIKMNFYC